MGSNNRGYSTGSVSISHVHVSGHNFFPTFDSFVSGGLVIKTVSVVFHASADCRRAVAKKDKLAKRDQSGYAADLLDMTKSFSGL